jgi:hypothetical protein
MKRLQLPPDYWRGMLLMVLVYTLVQLLFYHPPFALPAWVQTYRQVFRWVTITIVYVTGIYVLKNSSEAWLLYLWNLVHLVVIGYLLLLAAYEYLIAPVPYGLRASVEPIVEFLVSPIIYIGMGILYAGIKK